MNRINVPNSAKVFYVTGLIFIIQLIYSWYYDGIFSILFLTLTGLTLIVMYLRFLFKDLL
ncbi:MAG: hypothetical protein H7321_00230 [Bacteroidia bacterium]|nr:hypothetical protein [Bacteroidia bacterium]